MLLINAEEQQKKLPYFVYLSHALQGQLLPDNRMEITTKCTLKTANEQVHSVDATDRTILNRKTLDFIDLKQIN